MTEEVFGFSKSNGSAGGLYINPRPDLSPLLNTMDEVALSSSVDSKNGHCLNPLFLLMTPSP